MGELSFVDTNVLIHSLSKDNPHFQAARALRDKARDPDANLVVSPQVVAEFLAASTSPAAVRSPYGPEEALEELDKLLSLPGLHLLPYPPDLTARTLDLLRRFPARRRNVFDRQLAATMLAYSITRIYTFNGKHFRMIPDLDVIEPTLRVQTEP